MHYIDSVDKTSIHTNVNFPPLGVFDIKLGDSRFEFSFKNNSFKGSEQVIFNCHNYDMPNIDGDAVSQNTIIQ